MLYDVLIIGSGIAGLAAAHEALSSGVRVAVVSKGNFLRSNSSLASGGINAALGNMESDSVQEHFSDTFKGSDFSADRQVLRRKRLRLGRKNELRFFSNTMR